jgi:hypothetical protein
MRGLEASITNVKKIMAAKNSKETKSVNDSKTKASIDATEDSIPDAKKEGGPSLNGNYFNSLETC